MIAAKIKYYSRRFGIKALAVKLCERAKYKCEAIHYTNKNFPDEKKLEAQRLEKYDKDIKISICVPAYNTDEKMFSQMLSSVLRQTYSDWELCIADGSDDEHDTVRKILSGTDDSRIVYRKLPENKGISANSNEACALATCEYIALLDHDDILSDDALYEVRKAIDKGADFIYSDEASFSSDVKKPDVIHFKPDFSIFNLRGNNYICHLSVFRKSLFDEAGGFREGFEGSQDHDLILRLCEKAEKIYHIPKVLYNWRVHKDSVASDIAAKPYCLTSGVKAVEDHLRRMGIEGTAENAVENASVYRVKYSCSIKPAITDKTENIKDITNEYIIFISPTLSTKAADIKELCSILQLDDVGIVGGMTVRKNRIESASYMEGKNGLFSPYSGMSVLSEGYMKRLRYAQSADALACSFFGIKKSVIEKAGGFDEKLSDEDKIIAVCRRIKELGLQVVFDPFARAEKTS